MKWIILAALAAGLVGCEQTTIVGDCGGEAVMEAGAPFIISPPDAAEPDAPEPLPLLGDGAPCDVNDDCANAACIPSTNSFGAGYCYSSAMEGCIVVGEPSPMQAQCAPLSKALYVCGDSTDVLAWDQGCVDVGTGSFDETYHCCNKPGFP